MKHTTISETEKITNRMHALKNLIDSIDNKVKYSLLSGTDLQHFLEDRRDAQKEFDMLKQRLFDFNNMEGGFND